MANWSLFVAIIIIEEFTHKFQYLNVQKFLYFQACVYYKICVFSDKQLKWWSIHHQLTLSPQKQQQLKYLQRKTIIEVISTRDNSK